MSELTKTYLDRSVSLLPKKRQAQARDELEAHIARRVDVKVTQGESFSAAEKEVLTELGPPTGGLTLSGPAGSRTILSAQAIDVARWALAPIIAVFCGAVFVIDLTVRLSESSGPVAAAFAAMIDALGTGAGLSFWAIVSLVAIDWVTRRATWWSPQELRGDEVAPRRPLINAIAFAVMNTVLIGAILWQQIASPIVDAAGARISILAPELWSSWLPIVIAGFVASCIIVVSDGWRVSRWRWPAISASFIDAACAVILIALVATGRLLSSGLYAQFPWLAGPNGDLINAAIVLSITAATATTIMSRLRALARATEQRKRK